VDYVDTDDALNPELADSGKDPVMAMVSINVPIWHGKYRAAEREARLRMTAVENSREDTGRRLGADLALALYHFRDAERKVDLYGDTLLPKAEQSLAVAQQGFEAGKTTFISLIDAQRLLLEFQLAERRARADKGQRLAEIEMLTGREIGTRHAEVGTEE
jgi:outer membrane protein TolC